MELNDIGNIVENALFSLLQDFPNCKIPSSIIMPNHLHFIWFNQDKVNLSKVVMLFKGRSSFNLGKYAQNKKIDKPRLWQRSFYEHIIRDDRDYEKIYEYIENNPIMWELDRFHQQ